MKSTNADAHHSASGRRADDSVDELDFEDDAVDRIGDELSAAEVAQNLPPRRTREGGMTGGELPDEQITDDDLTPETLFGDGTDFDVQFASPSDKNLTIVDADQIGGGTGKDEAELARQEHPGP